MGGDGMGGLAIAIFGAMALMLIGGFAIFYFIGRSLSRHMEGGKRFAFSLGFGVLGVAIGMLAVTATFMETTWDPPHRLVMDVPAGFQHDWVILLEDNTVSQRLDWQGPNIPFLAPEAQVMVPASGVVRVKSFEAMNGQLIDPVWGDGYVSRGMSAGPAPDGINASSYKAFSRNKDAFADVPELPTHSKRVFAEVIREREGRSGSNAR